MKQIVFLVSLFFACGVLKAQQTAADYIYSGDGFEVKTAVKISHFNNGEEYQEENVGLYSKDGKVLVAAISCYYDEFYVLDGCETISSGAFQSFENTKVFIPSSVINIAPDAIKTLSGSGKANRYGGIVDGVKEKVVQSAASVVRSDETVTEVARYNLHGVRLSRPADGVNLVQMSDGTTSKQLVR